MASTACGSGEMIIESYTHSNEKADTWTLRHDQEMSFLSKKAQMRKLNGVNLKECLPHEVSQQDSAGAEDLSIQVHASEQSRKRAFARISQGRVASPPSEAEIKHCAVSFLDSCYTVEACSTLIRLGSTVVPATESSMIFAPNPSILESELVRWHCILIGAWVLQPAVVSGRPCISIKYKAALQVRRKVWFSDAFKATCSDLWNLIQAHLGLQMSAWKVLPTIEQFIEEKGKAKARRSSSIVALISDAEASNHALMGIKHVYSKDVFFKFIRVRDSQRGSTSLYGT